MVMFRKPVERSSNIEDRRTSARGTAIALAARDAEIRRKAQLERVLQRLQEQHQRALRQQQTRGR